MEKILFQEKAIDSLLWWVKRLWRNEGQQQNLTFKAPTGSGKTYMTGRLICELAHQPDWQQDVAFVWITFSDDLAMQLSLIHISEPTRPRFGSRMPSSA